jgi:riboflavin synthase
MFSGIVEGQTRVLSVTERETVSELVLDRPPYVEDASLGDSIAVNGVCLTVEKFDSKSLTFILGPETLKILRWSKNLIGKSVNIERSLKLGDRVHGHLVTGHVDRVAEVVDTKNSGEALFLTLQIPQNLTPLVWKKGSIAVNGVSLTVNDVKGTNVELCLIPETLRRTNLGALKVGDSVSIEVDNLARGILHIKELGL